MSYNPYSDNLYPYFFAFILIILFNSYEPVKYNIAVYIDSYGINLISILLIRLFLYLQNPMYFVTIFLSVISSTIIFFSFKYFIYFFKKSDSLTS